MGQVSCSECEILWKQYESVVFAHARVLNQYELARLSYNQPGLQRLSGELEAAIGKRTELQSLIQQHNHQAHEMNVGFRVCHSLDAQPLTKPQAA